MHKETILEKTFMDYLMIELCTIPGVRVWRQNTGSVTFMDPQTKKVRVFSSGVPNGAADLSGIYQPTGQRVEVETKAVVGRYAEDQKLWREFIKESNGLYLIARLQKNMLPQESAKYWAGEFRKLLI